MTRFLMVYICRLVLVLTLIFFIFIFYGQLLVEVASSLAVPDQCVALLYVAFLDEKNHSFIHVRHFTNRNINDD